MFAQTPVPIGATDIFSLLDQSPAVTDQTVEQRQNGSRSSSSASLASASRLDMTEVP